MRCRLGPQGPPAIIHRPLPLLFFLLLLLLPDLGQPGVRQGGHDGRGDANAASSILLLVGVGVGYSSRSSLDAALQQLHDPLRVIGVLPLDQRLGLQEQVLRTTLLRLLLAAWPLLAAAAVVAPVAAVGHDDWKDTERGFDWSGAVVVCLIGFGV